MRKKLGYDDSIVEGFISKFISATSSLLPTSVAFCVKLAKVAEKYDNAPFTMNYLGAAISFNDGDPMRTSELVWEGAKIPYFEDESLFSQDAVSKMSMEAAKYEKIFALTQSPEAIKKMIAEGTKIDMISLDYIDCVVPDKNLGDEWKSEGSVMRGFEAMCHELNVAGWTATQGNRSSISSDVVTTDQMGGSIKKAQVGHVIITVAKSLQQKEMKLATIAITKSRIGRDGVVFENCKFDNELMEIDTESSVTFLGLEEQKEERNRNRVNELLAKRKQQIN